VPLTFDFASAAADALPDRPARPSSNYPLEPAFLAVFRELKPRTPPPPFEIAFYPFAHINHTIRLRQGRVLVRLSDLLQTAPEPVMEALAQILLRKLYRRPIPEVYNARYRRFIGQRAITAKAQLIRQIRGRKPEAVARGRHFDLGALFDDLNQRFFQGWMARPNLGWAASAARRNLGHYDPAHNAILISRVFDSPSMPRFVLEYVLYHEMLHLRHPITQRGSRRCVHGAEFRREERRFPQWAEAEAALKRL
jgi:hypothetical protein